MPMFYFQRRRSPPVESTDESLRRDSQAAAHRQVHPLRSAEHSPVS
jgi:hypothetical protein